MTATLVVTSQVVAVPGHLSLASEVVFPRPFKLAADGFPSRSAASYALRRATQFPNTTTVLSWSQRSSVMGNPSGPKSSTLPSVLPMGARYASPSTSEVSKPAPIQRTNVSTSAPFAAQKTITRSHGLVVPVPHLTDSFFSLTSPSLLPYRDFSNTIVHRPPLLNSIDSHNQIYNSIIHPYDSNTFESLLLKNNLTQFYPILVNNLRTGFPLGLMPPLTHTIIIDNHSSATQYSETIAQYLAEEVLAGQMSGPFSCDTTEQILRGPFFSSPLIVSVQTQAPGTPDKLRVCCHLSKSNKTNPSVNSHVNTEDFPTRFDTASRVADIVSITFILLSFSSYPGPCPIFIFLLGTLSLLSLSLSLVVGPLPNYLRDSLPSLSLSLWALSPTI